MKAYVVISVARQVDGEYCLVKTEKAFTDSLSAETYANDLAKRYTEKISTPNGEIDCVCERGIFEVDIEQGKN